jgi:hypothetical protein
MGNGSFVNSRRRQSQIALPPLNEAGNVDARADMLIFYEQYSYDRTFTPAERASHPDRGVHVGQNEVNRRRLSGPYFIGASKSKFGPS